MIVMTPYHLVLLSYYIVLLWKQGTRWNRVDLIAGSSMGSAIGQPGLSHHRCEVMDQSASYRIPVPRALTLTLSILHHQHSAEEDVLVMQDIYDVCKCGQLVNPVLDFPPKYS